MAQFTAKEFKDFSRMFDFEHVISSPHFPRSNGLAEKGVQIIKRLLKKAGSASDLWLGLLNYRTSPLEDGRSPAELLMHRNLRTPLPEFRLCPESQPAKHKQNMQRGQLLPPLEKGDTVRVMVNRSWRVKAKVLKLVFPRSYLVLTEEGRLLRRNRRDLRRTAEPFNEQNTCPVGSPSENSATSEGSPSGSSATPSESSETFVGTSSERNVFAGGSPPESNGTAREEATPATLQEQPQFPDEEAASTSLPPLPATTSTSPSPVVRRSRRERRPPCRLNYDEQFRQTS